MLRFQRKKAYAPFFPKIDKCIDDKDLAILARDELEDNIEKKYAQHQKQKQLVLKKKQEFKWHLETPVLDTQASFSADTTAKYQTQDTITESCDFDSNQAFLPAAKIASEKSQTQDTSSFGLALSTVENPANFKQQPKPKDLKKAAVKYYQETHPDVDVEEMTKFLSDSTKQISGKPHYHILRHTDKAPIGLIYLEIVEHPKKRLEKTDDVYHVIQALLYAGRKSGYKYCDYVQHGSGKEDVFAPITIEPDEDWQTTNINKALKFCEYFDEMWDYLKQQYSKPQASI